ncbi:MAG: pyridoxamine 5'-phosphate oxidase [Rhodobacteraceae bacterium]|nr:pyridoxamine 5'-phosphate oxidase [Paracoccaceae bacterium]MCY4196718.1 pyridoxamine 5'-phosphate oxidase [Paracoccaceae bacterium]
MTDRTGIFAGDDPLDIIRDWLEAARSNEPNDPEAAALATVDADGLPNVRMVLIKMVESDRLVFFTNYSSMKAREIENIAKAALVFHWKSLRRQIRVRGTVKRETAAISGAYFASRSLASRLGAYASHQSSVLANRGRLEARLKKVRAKHGDNPKLPEFWGGFGLLPCEIEFWRDGDHRLHDRFVWKRDHPEAPWTINRLSP